MGGKYSSAVAVGDRVFFVPSWEAEIGVLDVATDTFSTISITVTGNFKYAGAAAVGGHVFFAPGNADDIGVLDLTCPTV